MTSRLMAEQDLIDFGRLGLERRLVRCGLPPLFLRGTARA